MAKVFITGSAEGLGNLAGKILVEQGHQVVLHARNEERAKIAKTTLPGAEAVVIGDVSNVEGMKSVANQANKIGRFTAVIHNVGVYQEPSRQETMDGVTKLFAVNVLAPYVLTASMQRPERLVYLSSGMHRAGVANLEDPQWKDRSWNTSQAYSDSKLFDLILAKAIARLWPQVLSNAVDPGWVPTRMGGASAPDDLNQGAETQAWLAVSEEPQAKVSGVYFHHQKKDRFHPAADDLTVQNALLRYLEELTKIKLVEKSDSV